MGINAQPDVVEVYLSESRFSTHVSAGSKELCRAKVNFLVTTDKGKAVMTRDVKLDTGGWLGFPR